MKIYYYTIVFAGIMLMMFFAGIQDTSSSKIISALGLESGLGLNQGPDSNAFTDNGITNSGSSYFNISAFGWFGILITSLLFGLALTGIRLGFNSNFAQTPTELIYGICAGSIGFLFGSDMWSLLNNQSLDSIPWVKMIMQIILIPLAIGYIVALIEFARGTD